MAKENISRFIDAATTDKALAEKVAVLASENDYDFTADELLEMGAACPFPDNNFKNIRGGIRPFIPTTPKHPPGPGKKPVT